MLLMDTTERLMTAREVAERLGVHVNTVKRIPVVSLPFYAIGTRRDRRYRPQDVERYLRASVGGDAA